MERKTFGWRSALNDHAARIEDAASARLKAAEVPAPAPAVKRDGDLWWSVALAQMFLAGAVVMLLVRSCVG